MGSIASKFEVNKSELAASLIATVIAAGGTYIMVKKLVEALDPTGKDLKRARAQAEVLLNKMGIELDEPLNEYELCVAANLIDPRTIRTTWDDIGGLGDAVEELKESVILPFTHPKLYSVSSLLQPPKGMLLFGPPGCGKTMIAKATAKAAGARFINLQASSIFDKWYGESQKRTEAIFTLAKKLQPVIVFIDEIDAMLRSRSSGDHESTSVIKSQFMSLWDGLTTDSNCKVLIMGATNRPMDVDPAFRRRMPLSIKIGLPPEESRRHILEIILKDEHLVSRTEILRHVAQKTDGLSGSDLAEVCRLAALARVRDYLNSRSLERSQDPDERVVLRDINRQDFDVALKRMHINHSSIRGLFMDDHMD